MSDATPNTHDTLAHDRFAEFTANLDMLRSANAVAITDDGKLVVVAPFAASKDANGTLFVRVSSHPDTDQQRADDDDDEALCVTLRRERDNAIASLGIVCREHDAARATADACVQGLDALRATTVAERDEARAEAARLREALGDVDTLIGGDADIAEARKTVRAALAATPATPAAQGADASASASDGARWLIEAPLDCVGDVQRELIRGGFTIEAVEPVSTHSGTVAFSGQMDDAKRARLRTASRGMQLTVVPVPPPAEPPRAEGGANA